MIPVHFRSFETRIVVFFVLLLTAVQVVAFVVISMAHENITRRELASQIRVGERVFERVLEQNGRQLAQIGAMLAADPDFRDAVAVRDSATAAAILGRHGARINAGQVMLVDLENRLLVDTAHGEKIGQDFAFPHLIHAARNALHASSVVVIDRQPYQLVVVPAMAQSPVAWIAMGFRIDDRLALDMQELTTLRVSFLTEQGERRWNVSASTLPQAERGLLGERVAELARAQADDVVFAIGDQQYQTRTITLTRHDGDRVIAVLQQSLKTALGPFHELQQTLLDLAIASILTSLFGSIVISRNLVSPIRSLAAIMRRLRHGDHAGPMEIRQQDEIGELASGFVHMRDAISTHEKKILRLAYQDALTSLPNRALFIDRLDLATRVARRDHTPLSILSMDLDRFKHINDSLGHPTGDRVLQEVGRRLKGLLRESDTVSRLGGDEFAIILPRGEAGYAREIAKKIIAALDVPITMDNQPLDVRTSIGIATCPEHGTDPHDLIRHADIAMYVAKRASSGYAVFDPVENRPQQDYLTLLGELRKAVEQDELVLHYQPKVDLGSGATAQAEALVRWAHPQRGLLPPGDFIPFAEQTGYIRNLTRWIIRRAIRQCGDWQSRGINVVISVNICARDLLDPGLPDLVETDLEQHHVDARFLSMEITENGVMEDPGKSMETLRRLNQLGIRLAIDDYGTGYSSLSYVKKLPVTELKIDQSFVRNMTTDADDAMIVKSTIELGHNMGMQVVAEGVEDLAIWALLRQMGCDMAQGYCISKPLPADRFEHWLAANPVFGDPTIPPAQLASRWSKGSTAITARLPPARKTQKTRG
ncbi:MAG: putative bifunctional diguanylate cyclase/phosphodiesterase [Burkholderiales bacterium]